MLHEVAEGVPLECRVGQVPVNDRTPAQDGG